MEREQFEKIVIKGIEAIPKRFLEKLENVDICVEQEPNYYQLKKMKKREKSFLILGLYEGVPQTKRFHYGQVLPDKITIFQKPIEKVASVRAKKKGTDFKKEIKELVKKTIWHEIAHHFGMDERQIKETEKKKKNG